jgi:4-amino-4-deoxy-L-arabinose transferase-like glycosyltransferase
MMQLLKSKTAWGMLLVCLITFFVNNQLITPDIMESRNIVTAREMVYDGNWLVPTMNGDIRLEKPPLPTWLTAVAEIVAPDSLALQRGMAGLAAVLLVIYFYLFAQRVLRLRPAWVPTLVLCTCYNVILMGRTASWDIYCHAFMMAGIYHFALAYRSTAPTRHFLWAGLWTALSLLSKGPVSPFALFLPFLIALRALGGGTLRGKVKPLVAMIVVALVLGCAWYAYIHLCAPEAWEYVARKESGSWVNHNVRPWWYYWQFFLEGGIWAVLLLSSFLYPFFDRSVRRWRDTAFAWQWMLWSLILLSCMPEKKTRYLLPMLVPASLLMGSLLIHWGESLSERMPRLFVRLNGWLLTGVVAVLPVAAWLFLYRPGTVGLPLCLLYTVVAEAIAVWLGFCSRRMRATGLVLAVTALFLFAECFVLPACKPLINYTEGNSIARTRTMPELADVPFYYNTDEPLRIEIVYAAHRKIRPLDMSVADSVLTHLPCVLLTHDPADEVLSPELLQQVELRYVGLFDDNRRPKGTRDYRDIFRYHLTELRAR